MLLCMCKVLWGEGGRGGAVKMSREDWRHRVNRRHDDTWHDMCM